MSFQYQHSYKFSDELIRKLKVEEEEMAKKDGHKQKKYNDRNELDPFFFRLQNDLTGIFLNLSIHLKLKNSKELFLISKFGLVAMNLIDYL
jgi:hypothetical protein